MTRKFHISFAYIYGNSLDIIDTTYEIDGLVNEPLLESIKYEIQSRMGYMVPPKILGLYELEESDEEE